MSLKIARVLLIGTLVLSMSTMGLFGNSEKPEEDQAMLLYIQALEHIIDEDYEAGLKYLEDIQLLYPQSEFSSRAYNLVNELGLYRDTSGLLSFYIGNLITGTTVATSLPIVFELGPVATGAAGIAGIGGSLYTSWRLTNERGISQGTQLQTDSTQITSLLSYIFLYNMLRELNVIDLPADTNDRVFWLGTMLTAVSSRTAGYLISRDSGIPAGKPASYLTGYIWTNIYLGLTFQGLLQLDNPWITYPSHILLPGAVGYAASRAWDNGGWSSARVGMLSVGGAGGMLIGGFVSALLSPLQDVLPQETAVFNILLFGGLGQAAAVYFTRNYTPDPRWNKDISMDIYPRIQSTAQGTVTGFEVKLGY
ncbi:hypothetical protein JCM12856_19450 [Spirochaeta dissipatitropha]